MEEDKYPFLIVVDIQPGYHSGCGHMLQDVIEKMNETQQNIIFFYVGKELDLDTKHDVIGYLLENGLDEHKLDGIRFIEKTYGYFRCWMDNGISDDIIIKSIKTMIEDGVHDSRDFTEEQWDKIIPPPREYNHILEEETIFYPDFNDKIFKANYMNGFELIGGGRHECLKEIELFLKALDKDVKVTERLCYGGEEFHHQSDWRTGKKKHKKQKF